MAHNMTAAAAAALTVALVPKIPVVGKMQPLVKVGIGVAGWYLTRKVDGATGAVLLGASIGIAVDGLLDLVPGLKA